MVITNSWNPDLRIWDLNNFKNVGCILTNGRNYMGSQITFIPSKNYIAVGFYEGIIGIYDIFKRCEVYNIRTTNGECYLNCMVYIK